jgi:hypothetical protein
MPRTIGANWPFLGGTADSLANVVLVTVPLYVLWGSRLPAAPKRIIRIVFVATLITSAIGIVHLYIQSQGDIKLAGFTAIYEVSHNSGPPLILLIEYSFNRHQSLPSFVTF